MLITLVAPDFSALPSYMKHWERENLEEQCDSAWGRLTPEEHIASAIKAVRKIAAIKKR
jgi:hypothetical protein